MTGHTLITEQKLKEHIRTLNACNQRGGRMLSLIDLMNAQSLDIHLAAYLATMMQQGRSILVGANPGGAGKTAVLCACLNFIPVDMVIHDYDSQVTRSDRLVNQVKICYLVHEIGAGPYYAYVWGWQARKFFALQNRGHMIASNLHADTLEEMHHQLAIQNNIPSELVDAVTLKIFLRMHYSAYKTHRWISHVYEHRDKQDIIVWTGDGEGNCTRLADSQLSNPSAETNWR
jgi:hypothetical protein